MIDGKLDSEPLPPLYAKWCGELLGGTIPAERKSSCDTCAMGAHGETPTGDSIFFDPVFKCCSYIPNLPNFLVGRALEDTDPAFLRGRATLESRIDNGVAVSPLGVRQPPVFTLVYENFGENFFGRSQTIRCPHYLEDTGQCGLWKCRNATCATWYCKHVRGSLGYTFWRDTLHPLLFSVEKDLARWCVLELGLGGETLGRLVNSPAWKAEAETATANTVDNRADASEQAKVWGEWRGREREFFRRSAEIVNPLSWDQVLAICGPETRAFAQLTKQAFRQLTSDELPARLQTGPMQIVHVRNFVARIVTHNVYDPLDVPAQVMELLPYFNGGPTTEAVAAIAAERGIQVEADLIRKMVDFRLLVEPDDKIPL